ncbi:hypothetical protein [Primorskyibacter sp. 2E107]|uniref:LpxL/LpxP family acyltransferase n=1 Tax=Primorskyibacter sp. 2E107 TaxID=3403458 RepID=UPI003AF6A88C
MVPSQRPDPINFSRDYTAVLERNTGVPLERLQAFWRLPYPDAVAIAQHTADGGAEGERYGLSRDVLLHLPGRPEPEGDRRQTILTQKILKTKIFQASIMTHYAAIPAADIPNRVRLEGLEHLDSARASGRPVCLLNGHVGPGQIVPYLLSRLGIPITHLGAKNVFAFLDLPGHAAIECQTTDSFHLRTVATGIAALRSGRVLHTTGDGLQGSSGKPRPFLGKMRPVPEGYAYMIAQTAAVALPIFSSLDRNGKLRITCHAPIPDLPKDAPRQARIDHIISHYLRVLEDVWLSDFGNVEDRFVRINSRFEDAPQSQTETL